MQKLTPFQVLYIIAAVSIALLTSLWWWSGKDVYSFVTDQGGIIGTLLTGLGGFWGVIYTLDRNAQLATDQGMQSLDRQRDSLQTSLRAELLVAKSFLQSAHEGAKRGHQSRSDFLANSLVVDSLELKAYEAALPDIGLLTVEQVSRVGSAYTVLVILRAVSEITRSDKDQDVAVYYRTLTTAFGSIEKALVSLDS
jgi:hypothetical protein